MRRKSFTEEQIEEILKAENEADNKFEIKRLLVLRLRAVESMPSKDIAKVVGYPAATVNNIISKYFKIGLQPILGENRKGGNKRYLTELEEKELLQAFESQANDGKFLVVSDIKNAYEKIIGKEVPKSTIYRMLKRQGWRKVMPRSKHPKSKPEEFSAYKKIKDKLVQLVNFTTSSLGKRLRLMFQDEAGFGRINKPKRCWCLKGFRPSVPCHRVREYSYAYAAVSPHDGAMVSLVLPYANTTCMNLFLKEISQRYPEDYILMVADNAAWHRSKGLDIPANIELFPLLPYSPELNPVEQIWDEVREKGFRNELFNTLKHVELRLCDTLVSLENDPLRVRSITGWDWIVSNMLYAT